MGNGDLTTHFCLETMWFHDGEIVNEPHPKLGNMMVKPWNITQHGNLIKKMGELKFEKMGVHWFSWFNHENLGMWLSYWAFHLRRVFGWSILHGLSWSSLTETIRTSSKMLKNDRRVVQLWEVCDVSKLSPVMSNKRSIKSLFEGTIPSRHLHVQLEFMLHLYDYDYPHIWAGVRVFLGNSQLTDHPRVHDSQLTYNPR